ncbi:hypothetical protein [Chryseobacterium sp. SIMBA_028]|uniref:hypothetical protein n=1 Tax=Chryseobacterium sp. SIMBA_028 TaxID=3085771 RepID=UPI00397E0B93
MKNIFKAILLLISINFYAQIDDVKRNYKNIREKAEMFYLEVNKPNKYFHHRIKDENEDYFIYLDKKKYDSLLLLKFTESAVLKKSTVYSKTDKGYYIIKDNNDQKIIYFPNYINNEIITQEVLDDNNDIYTKKDYKALTNEKYYFGKGNYTFLYQYERFNKNTFNPFTDLIYKKVVYQDQSTKIFNYEKDFPLSNNDFLKKLPEIFRQQSFEMLKASGKNGNFDSNTLQSTSFDMVKAISKGNYTLYKLYKNDDETKPFYKIILTIASAGWVIEINPRNEKIDFLDVDLSRI